ncbi:MAG TPA: beta-galactosidase, partial [bacterium]|nr:beta-galactosidase [bacterium]
LPVGSDGRGSHGLFTMYPSSSWLGCITDKSQRGLVFEFDWKYLDSIETWVSSRTGSIAQWFYRIFTLGPGQDWEITYIIYPVEKLISIDGVSSGIAGSLTLGNNVMAGKPVVRDELKPGSNIPVKLAIYSPADRKIQYRILSKSSGITSVLKQGELEISGFSTAETEVDWSVPSGDLLAVISAEIMEKGKQVLLLEQPVEIGRNIELYRARMPVEKQSGESAGFVHSRPPVPEEVQKIDMTFVSPHEKWAKPYAGGTTRMLFVYRNHVLVHLREIMQRGDFVVSLLATTYEKPYEQMREIPSKIKDFKPDVMFFAAFDWKSGFPPGVIDIIKNWVYRGGGLFVDADLSNDAYLPLLELVKEGKEIKPDGFLSGSPFSLPEMKFYELGSGRIVILKGGVFTKGDMLSIGEWRPNPWMPGWEYNYPHLISAILWAAHKEMQVRFSPIKSEKDVFFVTCAGEKMKGKVNAIVEIRNQYYSLYSSSQYTFSLSDSEAVIPVAKMAELQEGISVFKIVLSDAKGRVIGWTSGKLERSATIKADIVCDHPNNTYFRNEPVKITVNMSVLGSEKKDIEGILTISDAWNRTIWKSDIRGAEILTLCPDMSLVLDTWHQIILRVCRNEKTVAEQRQLLFIFPDKNIPDDDFSVGCWGHPYGNPSGAVVTTRSAVENGIDYFYSYGGELARDHIYRNHGHIYGPPRVSDSLFTGLRIKSRDPITLVMTPSLYPSMSEWEKVKKDVMARTADFGKNLGANVMMLDDERDLKGDYDWSETTLAHFPEWLKKEYGTISNLNRVWNRGYRSFEEVRPERKENLNEENLAPYIDFRKYIGWIVEEFYTRQPLLWVQEANPYAAIGMHGIYTTSSSRPWDMSKVIPLLSITGRYDGILEEWFRGMGKNCIHGQYTGYDMLENLSYDNRITPWKNLFHGSRWILYYQMRNLVAPGGIFQSIINYDGTVREIYRNLYRDELSEIKQGIGKLVLNAKPVTDGIIFTYSYTSCLFNRHTSSYFSTKTLVQDLGYQHDLISYAQLENYQIPFSTRILFLADCISMSESEIESVKKFVSSGGIVIADAQTAIYNQHGVKYRFSPIDEIFGVNRSNIRYAPEKKTVVLGSEKLSLWVAETGIKLLPSAISKGTTQDGQPVIITNSYGKGQAVYLNMYMVPYAELAAKGAAGEIVVEQPGAKEIEISYQRIIRHVLEDFCKIKPMVNISPETCFKEVFLFTGKQGETFLVGILPSPRLQKKTKISISLPAISNVMTMYDVRENKQSTSRKKFEYFLNPDRAGLLAFTPYSVKKIVINGPKRCWQGGIFEFDGKIVTSSGIADGHVIRIQVFDSRNKEISFWSRTICADGNIFNVSLPVDLSMTYGQYKMVATDIISGVKGTTVFMISNKK